MVNYGGAGFAYFVFLHLLIIGFEKYNLGRPQKSQHDNSHADKIQPCAVHQTAAVFVFFVLRSQKAPVLKPLKLYFITKPPKGDYFVAVFTQRRAKHLDMRIHRAVVAVKVVAPHVA